MSLASKIAHLPDGNDIEYTDTGPVSNSSSYKTMVLIHGSGFNGHVFDKLMALAAPRGLRLIALQRRDYSKSTPYTVDELNELSEGNIIFFDRWTVLLGHFIHYLIQKYDIPVPVPGTERQKGGIAVLGWSSGCTMALTLLSDANHFLPGQYDVLQRYLTDIIFYDPPHAAFGVAAPKGREIKKPTGGTVEEHCSAFKAWFSSNAFKSWISSYYDLAKDWNGDPDKLDYRTSGACASLDSWSQKEWETVFETDSPNKSEFFFHANQVQHTLHKLVTRNLFDEQNAKRTFPDIQLTYLVCWRAPWNTPWTFHCIRESVQQRLARNEFTRPIRFEIAKDANHFWHYECPEDFLTAITAWTRFRDS